MIRQQRLRRVSILCIYCIKNIAFKRARRPELLNGPENQFWRAVDGHFIDICVLEWCKLFGDKKGQHYWEKVITDYNRFFPGLLRELSCSKAEFENYIAEMKVYRDKFIAHLDNENTAYPPVLDWAKTSSIYLYEYLLTYEEEGNCFHDAPDIRACFSQSLAEGNRVYDLILGTGNT